MIQERIINNVDYVQTKIKERMTYWEVLEYFGHEFNIDCKKVVVDNCHLDLGSMSYQSSKGAQTSGKTKLELIRC